jgi:phosphate transport system substrate-binding protein
MLRILGLAAAALAVAGAIWAILTFSGPQETRPDLVLRSSTTIGKGLAADLAKSFLETGRGLTGVSVADDPASPGSKIVAGRDTAGKAVSIRIDVSGSDEAFGALSDGSADIALSARAINRADIANHKTLEPLTAAQPFALDAIAIIVNAANPIGQMTIADLAATFSGEVDNWQQLAGTAGAIDLYGRPPASAAAAELQTAIFGDAKRPFAPGMVAENDDSRLVEAVARNRQALGFASLAFVGSNPGVKVLAIANRARSGDYIPAVADTIARPADDPGRYPLTTGLYLYGAPAAQTPLAASFIAFAASEAGKTIIQKHNFILPVDAAATARPDGYFLSVVGSNTMGTKLVPDLAAAFLEKRRNVSGVSVIAATEADPSLVRVTGRGAAAEVTIALRLSGSRSVTQALLDGAADLGMTSSPLRDADVARLAAAKGGFDLGEDETLIAFDTVAVIVNAQNPVQALTPDQIRGLFEGRIANWKDLGGADLAVAVYARTAPSGTRTVFNETIMGADGAAYGAAKSLERNEDIVAAVASDPAGISFVVYAFAGSNPAVRALAITDGEGRSVPISTWSVMNRVYPLARGLYLYTGPKTANPAAFDFVRFARSADGQAVVKTAGYFNLSLDPQPAPASVADLSHVFPISIPFAKGSSTLTDAAAWGLIDLLAELYRKGQNASERIMVIGLPDEIMDEATATELALARARAVAKGLRDRQVFVDDADIRGHAGAQTAAGGDQALLDLRTQVLIGIAK